MGGVVWGINCTLDGRCGHEDGLVNEEQTRDATRSFEGLDALLMGRKTYELMFPYWAGIAADQSGSPAENEFAVALIAIPKVVFSSTLEHTTDWNTRVVSSSAVDEVRRLRDEGARLSLGASPALAADLRAAGLIARFRFLLHPVVAGRGPKLFGDGEAISMALTSAVTLGSGHVVLDYTVQRSS